MIRDARAWGDLNAVYWIDRERLRLSAEEGVTLQEVLQLPTMRRRRLRRPVQTVSGDPLSQVQGRRRWAEVLGGLSVSALWFARVARSAGRSIHAEVSLMEPETTDREAQMPIIVDSCVFFFGAEAVFLHLEQEFKDGLIDALEYELPGGPNSDKEYRFDHDGNTYTATPLSFCAFVVVHRPLTDPESKVYGMGRGVFDILSLEDLMQEHLWL